MNKANPSQTNTFYNDNFTKNNTHFDTGYLQIQDTKTRQLQSSEQMRNINQQVSKKQKEFQQFKSQHQFMNKKKRVLDYGYRSGIMNVDNPYQQDTCLYKDQFQKIKKKEQSKNQQIQIKRDQQSKYRSSNPQIEMMNRTKMQNKQIEDEYLNRLNCIWQHKKRVNQDYIKSNVNSYNRLFGKGNDDQFKGLNRTNKEQHRSVNIISQAQQNEQ